MTEILLLISSLSGLAMTAGGMWLIYREKIYIDRETRQIVEIEVSFVGKLKSNVPALTLFIVGVWALSYPIHAASQVQIAKRQAAEKVRIVGHIEGEGFPIEVYAVTGWDNLHSPRDFSIEVPRHVGTHTILFLAGPRVIADDLADLGKVEEGKVDIGRKVLSSLETRLYQATAEIPDVPTDFRK